MSKTTNSIVRIVSAGGGIIIDVKGKMTDSLVRIASAAGNSGAQVVLTNVGSKTSESLVRIAKAGKGNVIFDLR